ncbi:MAG: BLUF domain-containing protein, partial [Halofilum sp. (in: g-proteobacteria)]
MAQQPLTRLTYASTANFDINSGSGNIDLEIGRILRACKINNPRQGIGGVLHYGYGYFFQGIEGPRDAVNTLYDRIAADERHRELKVLGVRDTETRFFPDWSMKYVPVVVHIDDV